MKKILICIICILLSFSVISCGKDGGKNKKNKNDDNGGNTSANTEIKHKPGSPKKKSTPKDNRPLDLTKMSGTAVFSEVYNMMMTPEDYVGRKVKIIGNLAIGKEESDKNIFFYCVVQDATQCCQQGLEFIWKGKHSYPKDYPKEGSKITVEGIFEIYKDKGNKYIRLKNAEMHSVK